MRTSLPRRGEVWLVEYEPLDQALPYEQAGRRPAVVISSDAINDRARKVIAVPLSRTVRQNPLYVPLLPPEGGILVASMALCDDLRAISQRRLLRRLGAVDPSTLQTVEDRIHAAIGQ
jgi:mRNA interferase MazF